MNYLQTFQLEVTTGNFIIVTGVLVLILKTPRNKNAKVTYILSKGTLTLCYILSSSIKVKPQCTL